MKINGLKDALNLKEHTIDLRRDFHKHPELGFAEHRTAGIVAGELQQLGLEVRTGIAQTGVVGVLQGGKPGRTVMLRFDMDALPVQEENGAAYASRTAGIMHACGHDGHMAIGLTVARILNQYKDGLPGKVVFVFQPSEEGITGEYGAQRMVAQGVLDDYRPERMLALHLWNYMPRGWAAITPGPMMASLDLFKIQVTGRGGHAAAPQGNADPIMAACHLVTALQSITSRNVPPVEAAVVSATMMHGGDSPNVTPSIVKIEGTLRTYQAQVRDLLIRRLRSLADGVAAALDCRAEAEVYGSNPAVVNDPVLAEICQQTVGGLFPGWEIDTTYRTMLSEDCAFFLQKVPGCFMLIGSANAEKGLIEPHHSSRFDFDEEVLTEASALLTEATCRLLD